jgi:hypothetical protein
MKQLLGSVQNDCCVLIADINSVSVGLVVKNMEAIWRLCGDCMETIWRLWTDSLLTKHL